MKRTIKIACCIAMLSFIYITSASAQLGIQAGYVNSKFSEVDDHYNGFELGVNYQMPIMGGFGLDYSLLYTLITRSEDSDLFDDYKSTGHYLNLPVRVQFSYPINNSFSIFAYGGPNFTLGVGGKNTRSVESVKIEQKWYGDDDNSWDLNRFDILLGLGVGVRYNNIILKGGYDWGLIDLDKSDDDSMHRNQFNISLAYIFNMR